MSRARAGKLGRCDPCRIVATWHGKPLLRHALCPQCYRPLRQTTYACKLPRVQGVAHEQENAPKAT